MSNETKWTDPQANVFRRPQEDRPRTAPRRFTQHWGQLQVEVVQKPPQGLPTRRSITYQNNYRPKAS